MILALIGPPQSGKTTVFRILTGLDWDRPTTTSQPTRGWYAFHDERLPELARWAHKATRTPARVELWDPPSAWQFSSPAAQRLFGELRAKDGFIHVIPQFRASARSAPGDPVQDALQMERTLITADLQTLQHRYERVQQEYRKRHDDDLLEESRIIQQMIRVLQDEIPLRREPWPASVLERTRGFGLLSLKPILHLINVAERTLGTPTVAAWLEQGRAQLPWAGWAYTSAHLELELLALPPAEQREWMTMYNLPDLLPQRLTPALLQALNHIRFYTLVGRECRVWLLPRGGTALDAAALIHTDMARGFIRAEVLHSDEIRHVRDWEDARRKGRVRQEGRDYRVQDGDILAIRFSV